jgi:hypothetical protein
MREPMLPVFKRHAVEAVDEITLFYSPVAAKIYGTYTATIPDDIGGKRTVTYTREVADPESYLFKDKEHVGKCRSCDLKDVHPHRPGNPEIKIPQPRV